MRYAQFDTYDLQGIPCLEIVGAVDIGNIDQLEHLLHELASRDAGIVVISLNGAEYFDSRMIHLLAQYIECMRTNRQEIYFALSEKSKVHLLLEITGLLEKMRVFPAMSKAMDAAVSFLQSKVSLQPSKDYGV